MNLIKIRFKKLDLFLLVVGLCLSLPTSAFIIYELPSSCKQNGGNNDCINMVRQVSDFVGVSSATLQATGKTAEEVNKSLLDQFIQTHSADYTFDILTPENGYPCPSLVFNYTNSGPAIINQNCYIQRYYKGSFPTSFLVNNSYALIACPTGWNIRGVSHISYGFKTGEKINATCERRQPPSERPVKQPQIPISSCSANVSSSHIFTDYPINIATGIKVLSELDYVFNGVAVNRFFSGAGLSSGIDIGYGWQYTIESRINHDTPNWITVFRSDGRYLYFKLINSIWSPDADIADKLTEVKDTSNLTTGYTYYDASTNATEHYNSQGLVINIVNKSGRITTYTRVAGKLTSVTNDIGQSISIKYRADLPMVDYVQLPDGSRIGYSYITINSPIPTSNLASVTYPNGEVKSYLYGESAHVSANPLAGVSNANLLTGIIDENGTRYATYNYDAQGRAYDEELAPDLGAALGQPIERNNLVYNVDGSGNPTSTIVTDSLGNARTYNFTTILGVVKSTGQSQPAGSGCAAASAAITYDANGNVASRTDFNGNKTTYTYDLARNLETSRTEGLTTTNTTTSTATAATRTITTTYHTTWRLPLVISTYTGVNTTGTALHRISYVYDAKSNITSITEADPIRALNRMTTIAYTYSSAVPGLVLSKVVNAPRTDINDVTTYTYYPHDAVCTPSNATPIIDPITNTSPDNLGCRGQLQSMTNALAQVTTVDRYNHHGQIEQMTDANGVVTINTYDLRQRLLSHSIGNASPQTTTFTYDNAGQVIQLTMPDASTLNYTYDAAHRLTQVQDTLGNKVSYTLDTEGNRINEVTTDPMGNLAKIITRSYDALNRLQQVTGVE